MHVDRRFFACQMYNNVTVRIRIAMPTKSLCLHTGEALNNCKSGPNFERKWLKIGLFRLIRSSTSFCVRVWAFHFKRNFRHRSTFEHWCKFKLMVWQKSRFPTTWCSLYRRELFSHLATENNLDKSWCWEKKKNDSIQTDYEIDLIYSQPGKMSHSHMDCKTMCVCQSLICVNRFLHIYKYNQVW